MLNKISKTHGFLHVTYWIELGTLSRAKYQQKDFIILSLFYFPFGLQLVFLFAKTLLKEKEIF